MHDYADHSYNRSRHFIIDERRLKNFVVWHLLAMGLVVVFALIIAGFAFYDSWSRERERQEQYARLPSVFMCFDAQGQVARNGEVWRRCGTVKYYPLED